MTAIPDDVKLPAIERILEDIADTGEPANKICLRNGIKFSTFLRWVSEDTDLADRYARALDSRSELHFAELLAIADTQEIGTIETAKEWGTEVKTADMVDHRRLKIETRKWVLARMAPKKYGDRVDHSVDGALNININRTGRRAADD